MKRLGVLVIVLLIAAGVAWKYGYLPGFDPYVRQAMAMVGIPAADASATGSTDGPRQNPPDQGPSGKNTTDRGAKTGPAANGDKAGGGHRGDAQGGTPAGGSRRGGGPVSVATVAAVAEDMPIVRRTIGTITSPRSLTISSETQGLVTEVVAADGAEVKAGDVLVRIDDRIAAANVAKDRAAIDRDKATLGHARAALVRSQTLITSLAVSKQAFDDATTTVETSAATVDLDEAALKADLVTLSQKTIVAPFDGRLGAFSIVKGSLVQASTAIVRLTEMDPLQASFTLTERDAAAVRSALDGKRPLAVSVNPLGSDRTYAGTIDFVDMNVDAASGSFVARATLGAGTHDLIPGQSLSIDVTLGTIPVVSVPSVAVQTAQGGAVVYVVGEGGKVAVKKVAVALSDGDRTGLSSGLSAGEKVVVEGQARLTQGMVVAEAGDAPTQGGKRQVEKVADSEAGHPAAAAEATP